MKTSIIVALTALAAVIAAPAQQPPGRFQARALLIEEDGAFQTAWLVAATKDSIRYLEAEASVATRDARISDFKAIFIYQPRRLSEAFDLYEGRKYEEAMAAFVEVKNRFRPIMPLENNPAVIAAFFEMECLRRLDDLEGLAKALGEFIKDPLTRETQLRQLELYVIWDAVRTNSWDRVDILARERELPRLPGDQRAQVAYCHGLALEALDRINDALRAYNTAMTADGGATEELARKAALRVMAIHKADPDVQQAIRVWGTPDEVKNSRGYSHLTEAYAVAKLFELSLGAGAALPEEFKMFLQYKPELDIATGG